MSFLEHWGDLSPTSFFRIPKRRDEIWVNLEDVLSIVPRPEEKGSGKRVALALNENILEAVIVQYKLWLSRN